MDFQGDGGHVGLLDDVLATLADRVLVGRIQQYGSRCVDEVKNRTQVDDKAFLALAHEHLALVLARRAAGNGDRVDVLARIGGVVRNRLDANVVDRFLESCAATGFDDGRNSAFAAVTAHDVDRVGFVDVQIAVVQVFHGTGLNQGNRHVGRPNWQGGGFEQILETELEGDVFHAIAIVVHVDFIQRVGIHLEIVGAAVRGLKRLVVGQQGHVVRTATRTVGRNTFVTAEHVKVGSIDFGAVGDIGRFAVARSDGTGDGPGCCDHQEAGLGQVPEFHFHGGFSRLNNSKRCQAVTHENSNWIQINPLGARRRMQCRPGVSKGIKTHQKRVTPPDSLKPHHAKIHHFP